MISEWNKFKGWSVLEFFLLNPNTKIHINGLARKLKSSPRTAQMFCVGYYEEGLLEKKEIGNNHQFFLNQKDSRVKTLKKFIGPYLVSDKLYLKPFLDKNKNILSVSIYGSFATGDYGDHSDLDILVITADEKKPDTADLSKIELKLGRESAVTTIHMSKWRAMERKKEKFYLSIIKKSILIWGNPI